VRDLRAQVVTCVRVCAHVLRLVCVALPTLTSALLCDHLIVRARAPSCGDSSQTGKSKERRTPWYSS
jgi:hypothetical protein